MKKYFLLIVCIILSQTTFAQITIEQSDLPEDGDMYLMSNGNPFNIQVDELENTGANATWNFDLQSLSQETDTMIDISDVSFVYQLSFLSSDYADNNTAPDFSLGSYLTVEDIYNFYNLTSSKLEQSGFGAKINGFPLPVIFSPKDKWYELPLNFNDSFSSSSAFELDIPTIGEWYEERERTTTVDGWGTLQGPLGNQDVLRVVSNVVYSDSIYVDQLGFGFTFPREQNEYKWLMKNGGAPILTIITNVIFGFETMASVRYRDVINGLEKELVENQSLTLYPQPASYDVTVINPFSNDDNVNAILTDVSGRVLMTSNVDHELMLNVDVSNLAAGIYMLTLQSSTKSFSRRIAVAK